MKRIPFFRLFFLFVIVGLVSAPQVSAQGPSGTKPQTGQIALGTGFTYQGQLKNGGNAVNGACNLQVGLWNDANAGAQQGVTQTLAVTVTNGLFTTTLNGGNEFGANALTGDARWLAMAVRCPSGMGSYALLNPRQALTPAPIASSIPGLYTYQNTTSPNLIGGYSGNIISNTVVGGTIGGGGQSGAPNRVWSDMATVGGGLNNTAGGWRATVAGGESNTASGWLGTIGGGALNVSSKDYTTVSGGNYNTASANFSNVGGGQYNNASNSYATVSGGTGNIASGVASTVPGGSGAAATHFGEFALASGGFAVNGDAQSSVYVLRNTTTGGIQTELFLDGYGERLTLANGRALFADINVIARNSTGDLAGYQGWVVVKNVGGTILISSGRPNVLLNTVLTPVDAGASGWSVSAYPDNANQALTLKATGTAGQTVRWVATIRTTEVQY